MKIKQALIEMEKTHAALNKRVLRVHGRAALLKQQAG